MTIEIRDQLRKKGYDAKCVFWGCYDIDQNGRIHYLSADEGKALNDASYLQHPINLHDHAERIGLNLWYIFRAR